MALHFRVPATQFLPGSYVLTKYRGGMKPPKPPTRLHTFWKGPFRVISNDRSVYTLFDLVQNKEKQYHVTDLKVFNFDPLQVNPLDVARRDYLEFFVEKILSMTGNPKKVHTLFFNIKWLGYDETHNSLEPWANLKHLDILHKYLIDNNLSLLIPKQHRVVNT